MIRQVIAAIIDALATAGLCYLAFRIAIVIAPCRNLGDCTALTPIIIGCVLVALGLYFGLSEALWGRTPGQRIRG